MQYGQLIDDDDENIHGQIPHLLGQQSISKRSVQSDLHSSLKEVQLCAHKTSYSLVVYYVYCLLSRA